MTKPNISIRFLVVMIAAYIFLHGNVSIAACIQEPFQYADDLRAAMDAVIVENPATANLPNTEDADGKKENARAFLKLTATMLREMKLEATADVLNGNGNPSTGDIIAIWKDGDIKMERYDAIVGDTTITVGKATQTEFTGLIPLNCTFNGGGKECACEMEVVPPEVPIFATRSLPGIPEGYMGLDQLLAFFLNWSKYILGIAIFMMIFYGGVKWFFSQGNPSQIGEAQGIIKNAAIGAILLLSAYLILYTVNPDLVNGTFALPGIKTAPGGLPLPPPGGGMGSCRQQFGGTPSSGCSQISTCIDVSSYTESHDCSSNGGKCLLSPQASNKLKAFINKFNSLGGTNCSLKLSSAIQGSGGPSVSTCHKPGNADSGTCADFNISSYASCAPIFYKAAMESGSVISFLDEYVPACKPENATGGNIHVNF